MKKMLTILFLLNFLNSFSQVKYEFFGALKLNGNDKTLVTYRLIFKEHKGVITGYSISDFGGAHETKNTISGTYNPKSKELVFNEENILYTKSNFKKDDFCYVHFNGKTKLSEKQNKIDGDFAGLYKNGSKCISGTIILVNALKVEKIVKKISPKLARAQKKDTSVAFKQKVDLRKLLDDTKVNYLTKNQNLSLFVKSSKVKIEIWDAKEEDGDELNIFVGDRPLLSDYVAKNKKKVIDLILDRNEVVLRLEAISEGAIKPNTIMVKIIDGENDYDLNLSLQKNETTSITLLNAGD